MPVLIVVDTLLWDNFNLIGYVPFKVPRRLSKTILNVAILFAIFLLFFCARKYKDIPVKCKE